MCLCMCVCACVEFLIAFFSPQSVPMIKCSVHVYCDVRIAVLNGSGMVCNTLLQIKVRPPVVIHRGVTALSQDVKAHDCRQQTSCCNPTSCLDRSFTDCVQSPEATAPKVRTVRIYHSATSIK